jgi:N-acetylglucosaminyl-diphospho-decaprenol L-rhamnosyltransferase
MADPTSEKPAISVIILTYNGKQWLPRCLESLERQTIFFSLEIIITDNNSADGTAQIGEKWLRGVQKGRLVQNGGNLGYCEANNKGAGAATGRYLFFLNQDTWLEPDCLEILLCEVDAVGAHAATPLVLNYEDETFQTIGSPGLDLFGLPIGLPRVSRTTEIFAACGCSYLIRSEMFWRVGGFDPTVFMYADETDLSWRVWIAGGRIIGVPSARLHHRGATAVNPAGETSVIELRTNETKRFYTNRNGLLLVLKNSRHIFLLMLVPQLLLLAFEAVVAWILVRRWSHVHKCFVEAVADCFRLRRKTWEARKAIREYRQRGDFWMLRFLRLEPNRWQEYKRLLKWGVPKIDLT